jgi:energy-coupling factor transporter ATP-binding protein EcfA2
VQLKSFRVQNFRSVNDSGDIPLEKITALVGRNESGKSNLLMALSLLNPPDGRKDIDSVKNFPRGRRLDECKPETPVVQTLWHLAPEQTAEITKLLPDHEPIEQVSITRCYSAKRTKVGLKGLTAPTVEPAKMRSQVRRLQPVLEAAVGKLPVDKQQPGTAALEELKQAILAPTNDPKAWASETVAKGAAFRKLLGANAVLLEESTDELLAEIEDTASRISGFDEAHGNARTLVLSWVPRFVYITDFPELSGHQNLSDFMRRRSEGQPLTEGEDNFLKLAKVADFDPKLINDYQGKHEERQALLNRASALVTKEIRRLWQDRKLTVRLTPDGPHVDILIYDENADYPIEVNLDERSRGFRWFFSFYIGFSADTQGGDADNAVLLLDEPGLYLHARSQDDLLKHLQGDYKNQIIYTTHSPFMIPADRIEIVRTVNIGGGAGTTVTKDPTGDARTLFPIQAALGYSISQTLFVGSANLIVEGVTDFWILSSVNDWLKDNSKQGLEEKMVLTPAGGAGKIGYMVALLASQELDVVALLDTDKAGREAAEELIKSKILRENAIVFTSSAFAAAPAEADIEDIVDPAIYETLVTHTYAEELSGKALAPNASIPRIVKRYEEAFKTIGLEFHKTRPAREFMVRMGSDPSKVLSAQSIERFERLISDVNARYQRLKTAGRRPFQ